MTQMNTRLVLISHDDTADELEVAVVTNGETIATVALQHETLTVRVRDPLVTGPFFNTLHLTSEVTRCLLQSFDRGCDTYGEMFADGDLEIYA